VRLLVADDTALWHARFRDLPRFLRSGDLVVVNTSGTLAAAVDTDGVTVHFATPLDDGDWVIELRRPDQSGPIRDARAGTRIALPGGGAIFLLCNVSGSDRLWRVRVEVCGGVEGYLSSYGRPITYGYLRGRWPRSAYQTVFARDPGSAEMPSAGRPFTAEVLTELAAAGVATAPITLHTGVSSLESGEAPQPERYRVPARTAALVNETHRRGQRVIAVGTTVARALETVTRRDGLVFGGAGWTELILGPSRPARAVDGLITGFHEPGASHLLLLEAIAGPALVQRTYEAAVQNRYLWHEFGDSCLLLPESRSAPVDVH
jgi:S-adenosylmethionine:tRNA ribosyltransferase-isomerase